MIYLGATAGRANYHAGPSRSAPDRLLADPEPPTDLRQRQPTDIQLDRFGEVAIIETAPADRDRTADQMRCCRAAVDAEPLAQLHQRRAPLVQGHKLIYLRRAQKGLRALPK